MRCPDRRRYMRAVSSSTPGLTELLKGMKKVAMEYSHECAIPYISRIDAGTVELVRARGVDVASSGDLVQRFEAVWDAHALATHRDASDGVVSDQRSRVRDDCEAGSRRRGDDGVRDSAADGWLVRGRTAGERLTARGRGPGKCRRSTLPAYGAPHAAGWERTSWCCSTCGRGKRMTRCAVFADITWVGFTGAEIPGEMARAFEAISQARDAAVALVQESARQQRELRGLGG